MQLRVPPNLMLSVSAAWVSVLAAAVTPVDATFYGELAPCAVAGMMGGLALSLTRPGAKRWDMLRVTLLGAIIGTLACPGLHDFSQWGATSSWAWVQRAAAAFSYRGTRILACGAFGVGAQWIVGTIAKLWERLESDPWSVIREGLKTLILRGGKEGGTPP